MKKIIALAILFIFLDSFAFAEVPYSSGLTNEQLLAKSKQIRKDKLSGEFTRINSEVLKFEGYLDNDSYDKYLQQVDDSVKALVINSPGGDTNSGVKIGLDIQRRKLTVIVEGIAASSAANYLFLAGSIKIIAKGFVGFHGNTQAFLSQSGGFFKLKKKMKTEYENKASTKAFAEFKKKAQETIKLEKEFYGKLNISQKLFDITQEDGKGVKGEIYEFLLPSLKTMELYGIKNVSGRQDIEFAEAFGLSVIYY